MWILFFSLSRPEQFIHNMVNQLGRHSFNMEALMGKDLDQLAGVITGALHEVDEERPAVGAQPGRGAADSRGDMEGNGGPLAAMQLNQDQDLKSDKGQHLNQEDTLRMKQQGGWKRIKAGNIWSIYVLILCHRCKTISHSKFINALIMLCLYNPHSKSCQMLFLSLSLWLITVSSLLNTKENFSFHTICSHKLCFVSRPTNRRRRQRACWQGEFKITLLNQQIGFSGRETCPNLHFIHFWMLLQKVDDLKVAQQTSIYYWIMGTWKQRQDLVRLLECCLTSICSFNGTFKAIWMRIVLHDAISLLFNF